MSENNITRALDPMTVFNTKFDYANNNYSQFRNNNNHNNNDNIFTNNISARV